MSVGYKPEAIKVAKLAFTRAHIDNLVWSVLSALLYDASGP